MNQDCLFCKIVAGSVAAEKLLDDSDFIAIQDIRPQAKKHFLVIPKKHVPSLDAAFAEGRPGEVELIGKLFEKGTQLARQQGLLPSGFRSVINTNEHGGQTVYHVHLHILGGEPLNGEFG